MAEVENSSNLNKIRAAVSDRDMKIWENEAYSACIKKETEKLKIEIERLDKETEEMEKEDAILEEQLVAAIKSLEIQKQTLYTSEQSLIMQQTLKDNLIEQLKEWRIKYAVTLDEYNNEYEDYRVMYESRCKSYKDLRSREIELKKVKIERMDLEAKMKNTQKKIKQYKDIQDQILHTTMVKFANFYLLNRKNEETEKLLVELKKEEQRLRKEHFDLIEAVKKLKEKNLGKTEKHRKLSQEMSSVTSERRSRENKVQPKEDLMKKFLSEEVATLSLTSLETTTQHPTSINSDPSKVQPKEDPMKKFLNEEIATVDLTSLESATQHPAFINKDTSKVRVLDVKVFKPQVKRTSGVQKSTEALRRKMENIIENTKKNASRSSTQTTPVNSQQSQESQAKAASNSTNVSQTMSISNQKEKMVNPILKPKNVSQNVNQEITSQFFKTKSVTFQTGNENEQEEKPNSQENKRMKLDPKIEKKMTRSDESKRNKTEEIVGKFSFQTAKNQPENKFQFDDKENKSVAAMNIFRKPSNLKKEIPQNQGETKERKNFLPNISFGFFDNNKQSLTTESEISTNMTSGSFAGASFGSYRTEYVDQKSSGEELNDPLEFSFEIPPKSPADPKKFEEPSGPAPFKFGSSQTSNNLFNLF